MASLVSRLFGDYEGVTLKGTRRFHREGQSYYYQNAAGLIAGCIITEPVPRKDYVRFFLKSPVLFGTLPR
jgi:hypothetical protein